MSVTFDVYTVCWNEEKLLPFFCKHYSQARFIYIYDNESTDNSSFIACQFHNVVFRTFSTNKTLNDEINRSIKNNAWKEEKDKPDYVIVQDLDEFLFFPRYPNDIKAALINGKKRGITLFHCKGYQMYATDDEFSSLLIDQHITTTITNYSTSENNWYNKMLCFDPVAIREINYYPGAHVADPRGNVIIDNNSSMLLHYRHLGLNYSIQRHVSIGARLSESNIIQGQGIHYQNDHTEYIKEIYSLPQSNLFTSLFYGNIHQLIFNGKKCALDTFGHCDILSSLILQGNVWEPKVSCYIKQLCSQENVTYIDIGCNIGHHIAIAKLSGAKKIYGFECNPITFDKINNTVKINGWNDITIFDFGLSDGSYNLDFRQDTYNIGASHIISTFSGVEPPCKSNLTVKTKKYDDLQPFDLTNKIVVKIDIEGHELEALKGMKSLLCNNNCNTLIIELNPGMSTHEKLINTLNYIISFGFNVLKLLFDISIDNWAGNELIDFDFVDISLDEITYILEENRILEIACLKN